jgi:hypothetical protein
MDSTLDTQKAKIVVAARFWISKSKSREICIASLHRMSAKELPTIQALPQVLSPEISFGPSNISYTPLKTSLNALAQIRGG